MDGLGTGVFLGEASVNAKTRHGPGGDRWHDVHVGRGVGGTDRRVPGGIRDVLMPVMTLHRRMYPPERCRAVVLCALPTRRKVVLVPLPRTLVHFSDLLRISGFYMGHGLMNQGIAKSSRAHSQSGSSACENDIKAGPVTDTTSSRAKGAETQREPPSI